MAARRIPKEVQAIFDKYIHNNVRRLHRPEAITMMCTEFSLTEWQAEQMFDSFDRDKNGVMSLFEFQAFYNTVGARDKNVVMSLFEFQAFYNTGGSSAAQMVAKFSELDKDGSNKLDMEEAKQGLLSIDMAGRKLEEREVDFFLRSSVDDDGLIDLGHFANLLCSLKMYEKKLEKEKK